MRERTCTLRGLKRMLHRRTLEPAQPRIHCAVDPCLMHTLRTVPGLVWQDWECRVVRSVNMPQMSCLPHLCASHEMSSKGSAARDILSPSRPSSRARKLLRTSSKVVALELRREVLRQAVLTYLRKASYT